MKKYRMVMVEDSTGFYYDVDETDVIIRLKDQRIEARDKEIEGLKKELEETYVKLSFHKGE